MQNLIKLFIFISLISCVKITKAQMEMGANFGISTPYFSDFGNKSKGYGFIAEYRYFLSNQFAVGSRLGYYSLENNCFYIPLNLSLEFHSDANGPYQPYFGVGIGFLNSKLSNGNSMDLMVSPTIGTKYPITDKLYLNSNGHINIVFMKEKQFNLDINIGLIYTIGKD